MLRSEPPVMSSGTRSSRSAPGASVIAQHIFKKNTLIAAGFAERSKSAQDDAWCDFYTVIPLKIYNLTAIMLV